jgi:transposase
MEKKTTAEQWRIPDELWAKIEPLLPPPEPHPLGCHNPRVPDRQAMDAILFRLRTGCQWNALNATGICSSSSAHRRFQEWTEAGVFEQLWELCLQEYDELKGLEWAWQSMDGAMTKAPLGGEKNRPQSHRPREEGRETQPVDRRPRGADRAGGGRGQPERFQDGAGDAGKHSGPAPETHRREAARSVPGQGV